MQRVTYEDVLAARERIAGRLLRTPLERSDALGGDNARISYKLECQQLLHSFKARGALSKISSLTPDEKARGVLAVSSGNHGAGVALAAGLEGIRSAKVFVPLSTPKAKTDRIERCGAQVVRAGRDYDETHRLGLEALEREGSVFIDPCSDPQVIAGQGTIGLELLEQDPELTTLLVPIGGGGLITGIAVAAKRLRPGIKVIGVQTEACPAMAASLRDKTCYLEYPIGDSVCDALVGGVGELPYEMASECIDDIVVVREKDVERACAKMLCEDKIVAECAGAVGTAAYLAEPARYAGENIAIVVSGGNIDAALLKRLVAQY